jgi:hypothetical protein
MATPPNNPGPGGPTGQPVGGPTGTAAPATAPGGPGPGWDPQELTNALKGLQSILDVQTKIQQSQQKGEEHADLTSKKVKVWGSDLRMVLATTDDMEEHMKEIASYQSKMAKDNLNVKTYKQANDNLAEMKKNSQALIDKGFLSAKHKVTMEKSLKVINDAMDKLKNKGKGDVVNHSELEAIHHQLAKITKESLKAAKAVKTIRLGGFTSDAASAHKAVKHLFGKSGTSTIDKWGQYAQVGHELKEAHKVRADQRQEFKKRIDAAMKSGTVLGDNRDERIQTAKDRGMGFFRSRNAATQMAGGKPGRLMSMMGGAEEMGSAATGKVVGGVGAVAEAAGAFALPLAAIGGAIALLMAAIDKNQKMNSEVNEQLGKGGLYGGPKGVSDTLDTVKSNFTGRRTGKPSWCSQR